MFGLISQSVFAGTESVAFNRIVQEIEIVGITSLDTNEIALLSDFEVSKGRIIQENSLLKDINKLYLSGYFKKVKAQTVPTKNGISLFYVVEENPTIRGVHFNGNSLDSSNTLRKKVKNKKAKVFNTKKAIQDKESLIKEYQLEGYDLFKITKIDIDKIGNLTYYFSEGKVASVKVDGVKNIPEDIVIRDLWLQEGAVFNSQKLKEDRERILRLGYFSDVYIPGVDESIDKSKVNIAYKVNEKKVNIADIGLEQEEDLVLGFVKGGYHHLFQKSDRLVGKIQVGGENNQYRIRSYSLRYAQPWILNKIPVAMSFDVWDEYDREYLTSDYSYNNILETRREGIGISFGFPILKDRLIFTPRLKKEKVSPFYSSSTFDTYSINSLSGILSYQSISNWHNPKSGTYWNCEVENGDNIGFAKLGGLNFSRYSFNTATFFKVSKKSTIGVHAFLGMFRANASNIATFEAENYEIGGVGSLRGYKETNPFRSSRETLFNIEFRHDMSDSVQGVIFADAGKTFESGWDLDTNTFHTSMGLGFRFFTPVGPIRLDFAQGESFIIHFGFGQMF
jgi:outer membrane protein insertion porin family